MDVRNNMTNTQVSPNFGKFKVTKNAVETMVKRGEWDAFKPLLPGFKRLGKKADITIDHSGFWDKNIERFYSCNVRPKKSSVKEVLRKFKNIITLGLADDKSGHSSITIYNSSKSKKVQAAVKKNVTTSDFENLYKEAHKDAKETIAKDSKVKTALKEAHNDLK